MNTQELQTLDIPLKKLLAWQENVRTIHPDEDVQEMAASIRSLGLLQSLVVKKAPRGRFEVVAGRRRLQALSRLSEAGEIPASFAVPCRLLTEDADLTEISLAENVQRKQLHPVDEFQAFHKLSNSGQCAAEIAARFGVSEGVVLRRLALARVSPALIEEYRRGSLNLETLQAFTLTDDQDLQQRIWKQLPSWNRNATTVRNLLSSGDIDASDKRVRFVGLTNYEAAGGPVRRDLFAEGNEGVYLQDPVLLDRLVTEKLSALAENLRRDGWKWVEIQPEKSYPSVARMRRLPAERSQLPPKRQTKLDALKQEQTQLEAQLSGEEEASETEDDPRYQRLQEIDRQIERIEAARKEFYSPEAKAVSGAVVALGWDGEAECTYGLLRKEDEAACQRVQPESESDNSGAQSSSEDAGKPAYPAPLVEFLTTHKTAAIAAELAQNTRVALVAFVHALVLNQLRHDRLDYRAASCLQLSTTTPNLKAAKNSPAVNVMEAQATHWLSQLPRQSAPLWQWLLEQDQETLLRLLAFCAATSVNAIQAKTDPDSQARLAHANALATVLTIDMTRWFTPTAENFFDRVSKARIIDVLHKCGKEVGSVKQAMKKPQLAKAAEFDLAGTDWLPQPLRIATDFEQSMGLAIEETPAEHVPERDEMDGGDE